MKALIVRGAAALVLGGAALCWNATASAQTVVVQPGEQPAPPPPPQPAPVIVTPPATTTQAPPPPAPVIVNNGSGTTSAMPPSTTTTVTAPPSATSAPPVAEDDSTHLRPNRALLMTGLVLFGAPYVASMGIAATSPHNGDGNLWVPVMGPWLDLGARGGCPTDSSSCGTETGNKVLLVGDGLLQTVGALEIAGAFLFPEGRSVTTVTTSSSGGTVTFTPSKVGLQGYGLSALGQF